MDLAMSMCKISFDKTNRLTDLKASVVLIRCSTGLFPERGIVPDARHVDQGFLGANRLLNLITWSFYEPMPLSSLKEIYKDFFSVVKEAEGVLIKIVKGIEQWERSTAMVGQ